VGPAGPVLATPFLVAVPDYVQADWLVAMPTARPADGAGRPKRGRRRIGGGLHWAIHQAVLVQKTSRVVLPDVVLAQVLWGGDQGRRPRNWRRRLVQRLRRLAARDAALAGVAHLEADRGQRACPAGCALHGTGRRHQHLEVAVRTRAPRYVVPEGGYARDAVLAEPNERDFDGTFLGALEAFGDDGDPDRSYHWDPRPLPPGPPGPAEGEDEAEEARERKAHRRLLARVKALKRTGWLAAVYFPLKLFGSSPRLGLSWQERQIHQAITRELTRVPAGARSARPDKAEVVVGGRRADDAAPFGVAPCPCLAAGGRYVGFNGNGGARRRHLRGRGYRPLVWMRKAAYGRLGEGKALWRGVRAFLQDLGRLGERFGLVVAAWHPKQCVWRALAELPALTRTAAGRAWLRGCLLRVYTGEDFLVRWRRLFAAGMGFSVIPDTNREQAVEEGSPTASREAFLAYLARKGVSPAELARALGVSRSLVSQHLSGKRAWTASWQERLASWVAREEGGGSGVLTHSL
jgi:hypothetical protein